MSGTETTDISQIKYDFRWKQSFFDCINPHEGVFLKVVTPSHITSFLNRPIPAADVAICYEDVDRRGWENYLNQQRAGHHFVAELSPVLCRSANHIDTYSQEYHRLTPVAGVRGVFEGVLHLGTESIRIKDRLEFFLGGMGVTARLTRTRSDKPLLQRVIDFRCEQN